MVADQVSGNGRGQKICRRRFRRRVVGDLAGFAASIYMRGIKFIRVPTTLLAQVDSSVGGKTGMNMAAGKNMIGSFHQPSAVIADSSRAETLPAREVSAGIGEIIKHGMLADADYFADLEANMESLVALDSGKLLKLLPVPARLNQPWWLKTKKKREGALV